MSYSYTRQQRLTKADEFSSVFRLRCAVQNGYFQVFVRANGLTQARLGLVVAKQRARHAVRRNYMKRVIREYFRMHATEVAGLDIVVRVKQLFTRAEGRAAREALQMLWQRVNKCPA